MSIKTLEKKITPTVKKLVEEYWLLEETDKILIISDYPTSTDFVNKQIHLLSNMIERNLLARSIKRIIETNYPNPTKIYFIEPTYQHYTDPNDSILNKKVNESDLVFTLTYFSLTGVKIFNDLLKKKKIKQCSSPQISTDDFLPNGPIDVDVPHLEKLTTTLYKIMNKSNEFRVFDPSGSFLEIKINKRTDIYCNTGIFKEKGQIMNIPSGEVGIDIVEPEKDSVLINGKLNIFPGWTEDLSEQITLWIRDNFITEVKGGGKKGKMMSKLMKKTTLYVDQFGIGTNPNAKNPLSLIVADKIQGMAHISINPVKFEENHFFFPVDHLIIDNAKYTRSHLFYLGGEKD
ncbi:MAG: hypothetical protein ACTSVB_03300 [Candidatus Heimdallarchaeaceae archaeon]